jgi:uncharacterized protein
MGADGQNSRLVLPGGSGFLGRILARWFASRGWDVVVLTRGRMARENQIRFVHWGGRTLGDWASELDGATAVVNLAGRSVNCRYTRRNRELMMNSRVDSTRVLGEAIAQCGRPPRVWLNSSTATIYKHSLDKPMIETTGEIGATPEARDAFSVAIAQAWEKAFFDAATPHTRKVALRAAMVFGADADSVFGVLRNLTRRRLGGPMGTGRQSVSWIHERDFCRSVEWLIERDDIEGPVNLAAPNPVTNAEMMRAFRELCGVRIGLPATRWMLEIGAFFLRTETELVLKSRRVLPGRLLECGFQFDFATMQPALAEIMGRMSNAKT